MGFVIKTRSQLLGWYKTWPGHPNKLRTSPPLKKKEKTKQNKIKQKKQGENDCTTCYVEALCLTEPKYEKKVIKF